MTEAIPETQAGPTTGPAFHRVLLKLSGEALMGEKRYGLDPEQDVHALRMLRSALHGFATLEVECGFRFDTDVDESFAWTVGLLDRALLASRRGTMAGC